MALHDTSPFFLGFYHQLSLPFLIISVLSLGAGSIVKRFYSSTRYTEIDYFYQMLVGLIDGDGSFQVNHWRAKILQFRIIIKLKNTAANIQLLKHIQNRLGVGKVYINTTAVLFQIDDQQQIASILHIFATYPLLTTNMRSRFAFFKFCFMMRSQLTYTEYSQLKQDFAPMPPVFTEATAILNLSYFVAWLVGFTSAEGCFSIRSNGAHSFSISQAFDEVLITAIKIFFMIPNKVRFITLNSGKPFYLVETYNRTTLLRIIDFFEKAPIQLGGEKLGQFNVFKETVLNRK